MPNPTFCECDPIEDDRPVRQGDIFAWLESGNDPWRRHGIIITADCDIAHNKHGGILSYVPILSARDYLRMFHLPRVLSKARTQVFLEFCGEVRRAQAALVEFPEPLSDDAIDSWLRAATPAELVAALGLTNGPPKERLLTLANLLVQGIEADSNSYEAAVGSLAALREYSARNKAPRGPSVRQVVARELADRLLGLPGDAFFLSRIEQGDPEGHVVYLRLIRDIRNTELAVRYTDLRERGVRAKRVASLRSPFRYRLTQQLGESFSSIGLPKEYEDARAELAESLATKTSVTDK